ncbi:MAG: major capsid protein [Pseudonocardiales bacterium]
MLITTDYIEPVALTGYVRAAFRDLPINRFALAGFLPNRLIDDLDYRISRGGGGLAEAASFRAWDTESPLIKRPGFTRIQGELPPISLKSRLGEYDRLRTRRAPDTQVREAILTDTDRLVRGIAARMELARGEALADAKVTLAENGLQLSVDFARKATHSVVAATLWSNPAATPITDLLAWQEVYVATNGEPPGTLLVSNRLFAFLMKNAEIRNLVFPGANQPSLVTRTSVNEALAAFGLPSLTTYDVQVVNTSGNTQRVIPDNVLLMLPAATGADNPAGTQLGGTLWGTTAESLEPEFGLTGNEPGLVAGSYSDKDPVALWTKAAAIGLPVVVNPDLSFRAVVL